jgi:hypothetical protein
MKPCWLCQNDISEDIHTIHGNHHIFVTCKFLSDTRPRWLFPEHDALGNLQHVNGNGLLDIALTRTRVVRSRRKDTWRPSNGFLQKCIGMAVGHVQEHQKVVTFMFSNGLVQTDVREASGHVHTRQEVDV